MYSSADVLTNLFHLTIFGIAHIVFVYAIWYRIKLISNGQKVDNLAPIEARIRSVIFNVIFQQKLFKHPTRGIMHAFIFWGFITYTLVHTTSQMVAGNAWVLLKMNNIEPYTFFLTNLGPAPLGSMSGWAIGGILVALVTAIGLTFALYHNLKIGKTFDATKSAGAQWAFAAALLGLLGAIVGVMTMAGTATYEGIVEHFSLFVLTGCGYFAYRRWIRRAKGLDIPSAASFIVLSLISTLMLSTLASRGAQVYLEGGAHATWITHGSIAVLNFLGMNDPSTAVAVRNFGWWVHILTVYTFMVYVPTSKHSHLIFAPMNYFMITDRPRGQISWMDLEDENGVWGAGNVTELKWTSLMDGMSCIECGRCTVECPANRTGKLLDPKRIMNETKHAMLEHGPAIIQHVKSGEEGNAPSPVIGAPFITDEELWGCTSCYACVEACPVGNNQVDAIMEMRRNLVQVESRFPNELQLAFQNMENNSNPWGMGAHTRADWCSDLGVKTMAEWKEAGKQPDLLYWVGCAGSFDDRNKSIARSFVKILQSADVQFGILGTEENCTGDSARRGGNEYLYQTLAQTNIETLNGYGVKEIVTACPHCYNTLEHEYPQMGGNYQVKHHSDYIDDLIRDGKIEMDQSVVDEMKDRRAVYHDSCYLGRYNDIYEQPRDLARTALGMDLAEASDHHKTSLCCGAGGAQMWMEEEHEKVNIKRTGQLVDTGADTIATACPFCITMITDGVKAQSLEEKIEVKDVAELVAASMKGGTGALKGGFAQPANH